LGAAEGESADKIAARLKIDRKTVMLWRGRLKTEGLKEVWEVAPGRGRKPTYGADKIGSIVDATLRSKPKGMTHWSAGQWLRRRRSASRPELSRDAKFLEKLTDGVGLYLNPPEQAIMLCVDEKRQIQAVDRTQPGLPLKKGCCGTMTHDYKRNGTTMLFAALEVLQGRVIGQCHKRHRHQEFIRVLRRLDREFPGKVPLHLIRTTTRPQGRH
jgi:hypothetical protein